MSDPVAQRSVDDADARSYREMSSRIKFKQNLVQGLGAAMVFGIAAAAGTALFKLALGETVIGTAGAAAATTGSTVATLGMAGALPWIGIAAIITLGVGCLYYGSKFYAESVRLDQIHQAKQITNGMRAVVPAIEPQLKPHVFPQAAAINAAVSLDRPGVAHPNPQPVVSDRIQEGRLNVAQLGQVKQ